MGLSRNKVAVSEGAAGSPPFYGESNFSEIMRSRNRKMKTKQRFDKGLKKSLVVRFSGTILKKNQEKPERSTIEHTYGGVAQLGEHLPCKQRVMGSNPIISTKVQAKEKSESLTLSEYQGDKGNEARNYMGS